MIEVKLRGRVEYIGKKYYEVLCKTEKNNYEIVKILGACSYTMEQEVSLDCVFAGVEIIGEYYELVAREKKNA